MRGLAALPLEVSASGNSQPGRLRVYLELKTCLVELLVPFTLKCLYA